MHTFSISDLYKKTNKTSCHCQIVTSKGIYNIPLEEILFIECHQKKSILHTRNSSLSISLPLYHLKEILPTPHFMQTHRSFLVNLKNISYIDKHNDPWAVSFFSSTKQAFISRSFRHEITEIISSSN